MALNILLLEATQSSFTRSPALRRTLISSSKRTPPTHKRRMPRSPTFGVSLEGVRPEDFAERGSFFRFGQDPRGFDILPDIPGIDFDAAWERRVEGVLDAETGLKAFFISSADLVAAKLASGRPQDLADVDSIRKAAESQTSHDAKDPRN